MRYLRGFRESINWKISTSRDKSVNLNNTNSYILYNYFEVPIPIKIIEVGWSGGSSIYFESDYNLVNRQYWKSDFIGTEMEGLGWDPFTSDFEISDISDVTDDKIYLHKK
jgi:hypothetical protein